MNTLRYAWRSLAKSPGFVAVAILALGLGLGMSSTMFAVLDAVIHPYVAYRDPETLFSVNWWFGRRNPMRPPELYRFLRDQSHAFAAVLPVEHTQLVLQAPGGDEEIFVTRVPPRYFPVTGVTVERGRSFTEADGDNVAVLSAGVLPSDVTALVLSEAVLLAAGLAAALQPALRASRANPLDILRAV